MKIIYLIIFIITIETVHAQFLDNKLNIAFVGGTTIMLNSSTLKQKEFEYPSLWGNFNSTVSTNFEMTYIKSKNLWLGLNYTNTKCFNWDGDADIAVLTNPNSDIHSIGIVSYYFPNKYQPVTNRFKWAIYSGMGLNYFQLESNNIIFSSEASTFSTQFSNFGISTGLVALADISNKIGISLKAKYVFGFTENPYFIDKTINGIAFTGAIYYKLFINKYQIYE